MVFGEMVEGFCARRSLINFITPQDCSVGGNDKVSGVKARHTHLAPERSAAGLRTGALPGDQICEPRDCCGANWDALRKKKTLARVSRALEASLEVQHQLLVVSAVHRFTSQPLCCAFCKLGDKT